jgi:hypothetical protein
LLQAALTRLPQQNIVSRVDAIHMLMSSPSPKSLIARFIRATRLSVEEENGFPDKPGNDGGRML